MENKKIMESIIKMYNRNHCNKWKDLSVEEQEDYINRNMYRFKK